MPNMADNLTPMSIRANDKSKISVSPNRATIENSRSGEQDKASNNSTALPGYGPNQRKKTSFQITSVSGSRLSNDGGDDSADDLDESHTEDISDVVDNSRVTDNETPSFSEDTYSKEDVFGNSGAPFPAIVSTSSQCGLAITSGDKSADPSSESKSPSAMMTTTADGSGVVSNACPDRNNKEGEDSACGGEDQLQLVEKISTPLLSNEFEMQLTSGEIVNTLARQDPSKLPEATKTPSPPPHEKNRFKVVKIETAEPFKRGRWTCMDFLDHSINCSATLIKCMDPEDHRRLIEAKINNRWGSPPNSNAEILKPGYLDNLDQIRANIKAAALASKWPPRTPQISKPPQNPAPAVVQQQNQQQRGFGSSVPQTFTSNATNFSQSYYNQPNSIQNNHFGTQASNVVNNTAFITMQSNPNNNNQAYRMQTTPSNFIQQTGQTPIMQPGVFQQPRQPSPNVNYSQTQFTQRCSNAHAPGTRFSVSSVPCSTVVTGAQANNYIQQVPNTIPGQQRFAPSTPVSAFGSLAQGFMVQGQTYTSQQPVYNNIPIQSQTYAGQPIMTSLPQQSQPQPYTCQPSAVPSQGQTYAGQNVTAQGQTYAGFTASGVPLQPGQTYAGQQLNGQAVFQNPNYVQQTQIRPLLQPHQQQQSIQQNLQQTQVPQTMLQQQPLAQSQVQQPIPPNQNVQPSTQQTQPSQQQQQQTQQSQGVQQQPSQIQSRQPQSQPVTSQAVTSTTASGYNPSAPVTTQQSQTTTSTPAVTADSTVKSSDQQKSQSTAVTPSVQQTAASAARTPGQQSPTEMSETDVPAINPANDPDYQPTSNPAEDDSASGASTVAIDNKIEQAMDLVKSHLMFAVREEVEVLKEKIAELMDRINQLEVENSILKAHATPETLAQLATTQATASSVAKPQAIQAQTLPAPPSGSSSATS